MAERIYKMTFDYDFSQDQMDVDYQLIELGLAKFGIDTDWPEDGKTIVYKDQDLNFD